MTAQPIKGQAGLQNRPGAILVLVAVSLVGLLGMLALTVDIGAGRRERRIAQTAADAGAIGGGQQILRGQDDGAVYASALSSVVRNGFTASEATISRGPVTGARIGDKNYVEVVIAKSIPTIFGGIFNSSALNIQVRAIAGIETNSTYCVFGLRNVGNSIDIPGFLETDCGVVANSGIDVGQLFAPLVAAAGTVDGERGDETIVREGVPPIPDPLAYLTVPAETICNFTNTKVAKNTSVTLTAGVYCGGITIGQGGVANLGPGTYVLRGGGIDGSQNGAELRGNNVTIINTNGPGGDITKFKPIVFGNSCYVGLTASTSGYYKGIVIFQDPAGPAGLVNTLCGVGEKAPDPDVIGTLYFPTQTFELLNGNGKFILQGSILADIIKGQNGGGKFEIRAEFANSSAIKRLSLVQ